MLTLALLLAAADTAGIRGESPGTRQALVAAEDLLRAGKHAAARDALARIVDEHGNDLVSVGGHRFQNARAVALKLLATLPAEQIAAYRLRTDTTAAALLSDPRDEARLRHLVARYPLSTSAPQSRILLGEHAFQRGEFALAEKQWILAGTPLGDAKAVTALACNDDPRTAAALASFVKRFPTERGTLCGREGNLAEILAAFVALPRTNASFPPTVWTTLGADSARSGFAAGAAPRSRMWNVPLAAVSAKLGAVRRAAFHPVLDATRAYVNDGRAIRAFDLASGAETMLFQVSEPGRWTDADFTLTLDRGRLFARLGGVTVLPNDTHASEIVCVDVRGTKRWRRTPPVAAGVLAGWDGSPLVSEGRVLAVFTRVEGGTVVQAIACYGSSDTPLWVTDVCEIAAGGADHRTRHELLSIRDGTAVFASHSGAVVAIDTATGQRLWALTYPAVVATRHRDVAPAVIHEGSVFVAANDSDRLLALDLETGRELWSRGPFTADHILGIAGSRMVVAFAGPQRGLRCFDTRTGNELWQQHDDPSLPTLGRGAIIGDHVAWPTRDGLYILSLSDGIPARPILPGIFGNVASVNGMTVVASPCELHGLHE